MIPKYKKNIRPPYQGLKLCFTVLALVFSLNTIKAQVHPLVACSITGSSSVTLGSTVTFNLTPCTASSWTATCGTIQSFTSTSVTIYFNVAGCSSSTIKANGTSPSKTVTITWPSLNGGTISNPSLTCNYNSSPAQINASVASGGDCFYYSYQWYSSTDNINFTSISGANAQNYQSAALTVTTYFKRQATCSGSGVYTTNTATVTVSPPLVGGSVTPAQTINFNTSPSTLTLSGVSGGNGIYTYIWQSSSDNVNWIPVSGATSSTYTPGSLTSNTYFNVVVTSNGVNANSSSVLITVNPQVVPGVITPAGLTITSGSSPGQLNCTPASGGACSGNYAYQWQSSADGITYTNISGDTLLNFTPGTLTSNTWYRRKVTCGTDVEYSSVCQVAIGSSTVNLNWMRVRNLLKPGVMDTVTADGLTSAYDVSQSTQYYDGLDRLVQTVDQKSSPLQNDMVTPVVYDNFGRQSIQYIPYTATTNDGNYKTTALSDQYNFNAAQNPGEQYYYGAINYEASPLNRVISKQSPGLSWVGSDKGLSAQYLFNTVNDSVRIWQISSVQLSLPSSSSSYLVGQLYKIIITDEEGHQVIEYKDKLGKIILIKKQLASSPSTGHAGWLCTYYVYDTLQNLRFIIQPQAVALINGSWSISQSIANELCFRYEYDGRRNMAIKKVPGKGQQWMIYDARGRVVMTQDSALRSQQKWMFLKYDAQNRVDSTGLITDPSHYSSLAYHDTLAYHSVNYPTVASYTNELLTQAFYDDYNWVGTYSAPIGSSMATTYTGNSSYFITTYNASPTYAVPITPSTITHGMPTGSMKKVVGTANQFLYTANFYDDHARVIQTQSSNYTGAIDTVTIQYNFDGAVLRNLLNHRKNGNTVQNHIVLTKMDYDHRFRLRHQWKNMDNAPSDQLIDSLQYNERGQLKAKYLGNNIDSMVYDYNIRGWITGINKSYVAGTANHYFGMELGYDKTLSSAPGNTYATPEYNGNIEGTVWKTAGSGVNRKYDYSYDNVNRLTAANFTQYNGSGFDVSAGINFTTNNLSYDANGNILTMRQYGFMVGSSNPIDELKYTYQTNSNKLNQVYDTANNPTSLLGDFHYAGTKGSFDYAYDGNGNQVIDSNKSISLIHYNYLNLPDSIVFSGKGYIKYIYDAGGTKLQKITVDNVSNKGTFTTYVAGFVYQRTTTPPLGGGGIDTLQFVSHEEGRIRWAWHKYTNGTTGYKYEYDFFERDNLNNTRVVLTQEKDTTNYLASMETAYRTTEAQLFSNITNTCYPWSTVPGSSGIPSGQKLAITNPNDSVAKVDFNGTSGSKTGPGLLLKVMSGDTVSMAVQSYYNTNTITTTNSSFNDVLNSFAAGIVATPTGAAKGTLANYIAGSSPVYSAVSSFLGTKDPAPPSGYPKAYLNWILLDDQFNYVSGSSGSVAAASTTYPAATLNTVAPDAPLTIPKNGYLYVWVSNETQGWDVFFDNLSVQHRQGPLLEENHYYPFGLGMEGISDKAIKTNYAENKYRYNSGSELQNKEFSDGTGLQMYETGYRTLDPQLGRFSQVDPLSDQSGDLSPYAFVGNNPVSFADPTGLKAAPPGGFSNYNPAYQQYQNSLADPMHHGDDWGGDFMAGGGGGGGFDGNGNFITGNRAQQGASFLMNLFNGAAPDGFGNFADFTEKSGSSKGQQGNWISYTYSVNDGVYGGFGNETILNTAGIGWGFVKDGSSAKGSESDLTWWDYTKTSVALAGAIVETAVGGLTAETGLGAVVAVDGSIRVTGNFSKLMTMIETGKKSESDLIPTNSGAILGAIIDHGTGNIGQMQSILGTVNDVGSAFVSVSTDYEVLNSTDHWLNSFKRPGPYVGIPDDYQSIKEYH